MSFIVFWIRKLAAPETIACKLGKQDCIFRISNPKVGGARNSSQFCGSPYPVQSLFTNIILHYYYTTAPKAPAIFGSLILSSTIIIRAMFTNIIRQFDIIIRQFGGFLTQFSVVFLNFRFAILWIPIFPTNKLWKFKDAGPANLLKQSLNTDLWKSHFSKCVCSCGCSCSVTNKMWNVREKTKFAGNFAPFCAKCGQNVWEDCLLFTNIILHYYYTHCYYPEMFTIIIRNFSEQRL